MFWGYLEGADSAPPRTQATSRSPPLLGLNCSDFCLKVLCYVCHEALRPACPVKMMLASRVQKYISFFIT